LGSVDHVSIVDRDDAGRHDLVGLFQNLRVLEVLANALEEAFLRLQMELVLGRVADLDVHRGAAFGRGVRREVHREADAVEDVLFSPSSALPRSWSSSGPGDFWREPRGAPGCRRAWDRGRSRCSRRISWACAWSQRPRLPAWAGARTCRTTPPSSRRSAPAKA